jgi:2-amino-4-hydroxy-6-hydroxymethyldihydropteridine diphosphokinase
MSTAYLLMGGNMGDRLAYLQQATSLIQKYCGKVITASAVYETAAWGFTDQSSFYNQALVIHTELSPEELMQELLRIETSMGRERLIHLGPRTIDLDILLIDQQTIVSDLLTLPHPFLPERRFALIPLCEVAPDLMHPVLHKTIRELLAICPDNSDVQKKSGSAN